MNIDHKTIIDRLMLLRKPGTKPEFVIGGGAALSILGYREGQTLDDIDAYCANQKTLNLAHVPHPIEVDITNSTYFWGQVNLGDANKSPILFENSEIKIQYLTAESMFIHKADAAREKDIIDVEKLANYLDKHAILARMAELKRFNPYDTWYLSAENLLAEIQCQYKEVITLDMIDMLGFETDDAYVLSRTFGVQHCQQESQISDNKSHATGVRL